MTDFTGELLFDIVTPLGFAVHCSREYWDFIVSMKHPVLAGHELEIMEVLAHPDEVRQSRKDVEVFCSTVALRRDGSAPSVVGRVAQASSSRRIRRMLSKQEW